jgi:hypothetical protein
MSIEKIRKNERVKIMKDTVQTDRAAIIGRITRMLTEADDRTLREIDRLVLSWTLFRKEQPAISKAEKRMQEKKNAKGK